MHWYFRPHRCLVKTGNEWGRKRSVSTQTRGNSLQANPPTKITVHTILSDCVAHRLCIHNLYASCLAIGNGVTRSNGVICCSITDPDSSSRLPQIISARIGTDEVTSDGIMRSALA